MASPHNLCGKFMTVTHHAYNLVKLPGLGGTIVIRGMVSDALYTAQAAYKAAAVASPAGSYCNAACTDPVALSLATCQLFSMTTTAHRQDVLLLAYKFSKPLAQHHRSLHQLFYQLSIAASIAHFFRFPAINTKYREPNHGQRQETSSIGKEVAEDGSSWKEEAHGDSQGK